jgi:hypothetical protein
VIVRPWQNSIAGEPVDLVITLRNDGKAPLLLWETRPDDDFHFVVHIAGQREPTPRTRYGDLNDEGRGIVLRRSEFSLAPGQEVSYRVRLNRLFDMTYAAVYTVQTTYTPRPPDQSVKTAKGNEVSLEVTEPYHADQFTLGGGPEPATRPVVTPRPTSAPAKGR